MSKHRPSEGKRQRCKGPEVRGDLVQEREEGTEAQCGWSPRFLTRETGL